MRRQAKLYADMGFTAPHLSDWVWQSVNHQIKSIRQKNIGWDHQACASQRYVPDANHFHVGAVEQINKSNKIAYIDARRLSTVVMGPHGEHMSAYQGSF